MPSALSCRFWQCRPSGHTTPSLESAQAGAKPESTVISVVLLQTLSLIPDAINLQAYEKAVAGKVCAVIMADAGGKPTCQATATVLNPSSSTGHKLHAPSTTVGFEVLIHLGDSTPLDVPLTRPITQLAAHAAAALLDVDSLIDSLTQAVTDLTIDVVAVAKDARASILKVTQSALPTSAPSTTPLASSPDSEPARSVATLAAGVDGPDGHVEHSSRDLQTSLIGAHDQAMKPLVNTRTGQ